MIEVETYTLYKLLKTHDINLLAKLNETFFTGYNLVIYKKLESYYMAHQLLCNIEEFTALKKDATVDNYYQKHILDPEFEKVNLDNLFLVRQLEENYTKRKVLDGIDELLENYDTLEKGEVVDMIGKLNIDLNTNLTQKEELWDTADIETFPDAEAFVIYPSGLSNEWDSINGGFALQEAVLLGGRRGSGKSIISLNALRARYEQGHTVALFSIEMRYKEVYNRLMSSVSGIPFLTLYKGETTVTDQLKLAAARLKFYYEDTEQARELLLRLQTDGEFKEFDKNIVKLPKKQNRFFIIDDVNLNLTKIDNYMNMFAQKYPNYTMSVVDYLNIVKIPDRLNWQSQIMISDMLKVYARQYNQTVLAPYQIAEDGEARFAKGILDSADKSLIFMPQDKVANEESVPYDHISKLKMYTAKIRNGVALSFEIGIHWPTVRVFPGGQLINSQLLPGERYGSEPSNKKDIVMDLVAA